MTTTEFTVTVIPSWTGRSRDYRSAGPFASHAEALAWAANNAPHCLAEVHEHRPRTPQPRAS